MHYFLLLYLSFELNFSSLHGIPGIEFGDNKAKKYFTEDNGLAELTFKENIELKTQI